MPLSNCKKCNHIYDTQTKTCPYCGEENRAAMSRDLNLMQAKIKNLSIAIFACSLLATFLFLNATKTDNQSNSASNVTVVAQQKQSCQMIDCPAGSHALTRATQQDPFYTCKSAELAEYANFVLRVMISKSESSKFAPPISRVTGEPVVEGEEQLLMDKYRANAGVSTFEQAISKCYKGRDNLKVVVLYDAKNGSSVYVSPEDNPEEKFWLPTSKLDKL